MLTRIERREFKFLIPREAVASVRAWIAPFCLLDPASAAIPGDRYLIESLYFDTADHALFEANEQERLDRFKLRVRRYPDDPGDRVFFEVKRRVHDVILKQRAAVPRASWARLCDDPFAPVPAALSRAAEAFLARVHAYAARPVAVVRYAREAWVSTVDDYTRVTFDTHICARRATGCTFEGPRHEWRALDDVGSLAQPHSPVVLELKFVGGAAPSWMQRLVERHDLSRRSFSKYGQAVRAFVPSRSNRGTWAA